MMTYEWVYHNDVSARKRLRRNFFSFIKSLPYVNGMIRKEISKETDFLHKSVAESVGNTWLRTLPDEPKKMEEITKIMQQYINYDTVDWKAELQISYFSKFHDFRHF